MARKMKESGFASIGQIPTEWSMQKVKNAFYRSKAEAHIEDPIVLSLARSGVKIRDISTNEGQLAESYYNYNPVVPGDLLLNPMDLYSGANCSISKVEGVISPAYINLRTTGDYSPVYYDYYFKTQYWSMSFFAHGKGVSFDNRWTLSPNDLLNYPIPVPSFEEQKCIAEFLDSKCNEIDSVIEKTKSTIEEYKKLKQAIVIDAVTKGIRGNRPMIDSGIEWIGDIPADWNIRVAFQLFKQVKNKNEGLVEKNLLSLSYGKIKRKNINTVGGLLPENFDGYNIIEKDDIVLRLTDLQNDHTSLRVGLSTERGIVTSAYVTLRNQSENTPLYLYYYLHSFDLCKGFYGMGAGVRQGLNWDGLKLLKVVLPPIEEQKEITDYLEQKCSEIDTLIAKKTALLAEMESYKKSVIYEYVTGKKEVGIAEQSVTTIVYPYFPAVLSTDKARFAQAVLMSRILDKCRTKMGRVKLEKMLYTIECSIGFNFDTEYVREAAGPLDTSIYECEGIISRKNRWYDLKSSKHGVSYIPTKNYGKYEKYYDKYFGEYDAEIARIINIFKDYEADQAEIIATLFAAWNDAIIDRKQASDEEIVDDVLNNWNESKKRFPRDVWLRAIAQMRKQNLIPKGYGKHTIIKN